MRTTLLINSQKVYSFLCKTAFAAFLAVPTCFGQEPLAWVKTIGGTGSDAAVTTAFDANGNMFVVGSFYETTDFDPGVGVTNLVSNGFSDAFLLKLDKNGDFLWVKQFGGSYYEQINAIVVAPSGNIYLGGYFGETFDFDPGTATVNITSKGESDDFIAKVTANGDLMWVKTFGGTGTEISPSIVLDAAENIFTTGAFSKTVDFDGGAGTTNVTSKGAQDVFVLKMDKDGVFQWVKSYGDSGSDFVQDIKLDGTALYTIGSFEDTVDFDPGSGSSKLIGEGILGDAYILKLDVSGNFIWAKDLGGKKLDSGRALDIDEVGNLYATTRFQDTLTVSTLTGPSQLISKGQNDILIVKLNSSGNFIWAKGIGGPLGDHTENIVLDGTGNIYMTGSFTQTCDFDPSSNEENLTSAGSADIFILKLTVDGNLVWVRQMGSTDYDSGSSLTFDKDGTLYTTGGFRLTVDLDLGSEVKNFTSSGNSDFYIQKYASSALVSLQEGVELSLYPNPTNKELTIQSNRSMEQILIKDLNGKTLEVYQPKIPMFSCAMDDFNPGVYFIEIITDQGVAVRRLTKL